MAFARYTVPQPSAWCECLGICENPTQRSRIPASPDEAVVQRGQQHNPTVIMGTPLEGHMSSNNSQNALILLFLHLLRVAPSVSLRGDYRGAIGKELK